ncbi:Phosphatidylinositol 4,5-bisphosphate 3-kinase catalytic subunit beta isoform [Manis javanica]|nr:Phosphatidylinositol 4,5-bisphosphate 3-kinase catalytic subunit beta isoform [Manis javanica]
MLCKGETGHTRVTEMQLSDWKKAESRRDFEVDQDQPDREKGREALQYIIQRSPPRSLSERSAPRIPRRDALLGRGREHFRTCLTQRGRTASSGA